LAASRSAASVLGFSESSSSVYVLRNELQQASLCGVHTVQRPSLSAMQTDLSHALVLHIASRRILRCTRMPNAAREYFKHRIQSSQLDQNSVPPFPRLWLSLLCVFVRVCVIYREPERQLAYTQLCLPKPHAAARAPHAGGIRRVSRRTTVQDGIANSVPVWCDLPVDRSDARTTRGPG
jgi:hypothetical protein